MRTKAGILALLAELESDVELLKRMAGQNRQAWERVEAGAHDPLDWGALGYTLHGLYGVLENYFLRISRFFENSIASDRWHRELLEKMRVDIPGMRPALFDREEDFLRAVNLMKFRHRFRNLYGEDLDPAKTSEVQRDAMALTERFQSIHGAYTAKLRAIAEGLS